MTLHKLKMVRKVETSTEFQAFIESESVTVVDYYADWCGPCRAVAPAFTELSVKFPDAQFIKVNTDDLPELANAAYITSIPTFIIYKEGKKLDEMKGANVKVLTALVSKHCQ